MEIMLDKKQIRVIFLHKFKIGPKAVETTQNQQGIWPRNCWQTYSAVVVQEVLQWRQEHWKRVAGVKFFLVFLLDCSFLWFLRASETFPANFAFLFFPYYLALSLISCSILWGARDLSWDCLIFGPNIAWYPKYLLPEEKFLKKKKSLILQYYRLGQ